MEAVQERKPRAQETSNAVRKNESRVVIEIEEITLREIKIYADADNIDLEKLVKRMIQKV